ncbi:GAF domain-containing protein [Paraglaciecola psychrophila]|uniref:GAF domain-containing protein n=1 Tax=Paraglaciecola psychrophila 170 TaxID=1129794 RepID=K7ALW2_9ALTE|nr:GAF domain-containing protein [Paraglaciecola psychrophila]AGH45041.1 GAF domain-containing protein [Paraglaciecola psychrophila 170]GAC36385.1 GAF domain-containing protein A [Paraglaciecola psychrophila 170]
MAENKQQHYSELAQQIEAIVAGESDFVANMANISAILYWGLDNVNWAGFYLVKEGQLVLGPFHGQPACIRIPIGKGVCGTSVSENCIQLIDDVHQFSGHIACDAASNSEIVLPIRHNNHIVAVLDIDSPNIRRFDLEDKTGLSQIVEILQTTLYNADEEETRGVV